MEKVSLIEQISRAVECRVDQPESGCTQSSRSPAADFIRACLHLDLSLRPTAQELMEHPWIMGGLMCADYREP
jgi:serine/threonine protein kinase